MSGTHTKTFILLLKQQQPRKFLLDIEDRQFQKIKKP